MLLARIVVALTFAAALLAPLRGAAAPWIVVSDIHVDFRSTAPAWGLGEDTGEELFDDTIAELRRADPNAPVIIVAGDTAAHSMRSNRVTPTIVEAARRLRAAFPKAQFVLALGNNDSTCGDYQTQRNGRFLHDVGAAWRPLISRASPDFDTAFRDSGSYAVNLPGSVTAVVLDDVPFAFRYRDACGGDGANFVGRALSVVRRDARAAAARGRKVWVVTHLPPGVDAYSSTHLTRQLVTIPFLRKDAQDAFLGVLRDPENHVSVLLAGHSHKFAFRDAAGVPALLAPSVSPVMRNAPSFLLMNVGAAGEIGAIVQYARGDDGWQRLDDTRSLGMRSFSIAGVRELDERIARDPLLRERFARDYVADGSKEILEGNWRGYWCAQTTVQLDEYRSCISPGEAGQLRTRTRLLLLGALAAAAAFAGWLVLRRFSANEP